MAIFNIRLIVHSNTMTYRPLDMTRVQEIVKAKMNAPLFPGVISVFQYPPDVMVSVAVPQVITAGSLHQY
jgi:hypothetical protein